MEEFYLAKKLRKKKTALKSFISFFCNMFYSNDIRVTKRSEEYVDVFGNCG